MTRLKRHTDLPVAVGFGIRTPEQAAAVARVADGVVVGSALVERIAGNLDAAGKAKPGTAEAVLGLVRELARRARRAARHGKVTHELAHQFRPSRSCRRWSRKAEVAGQPLGQMPGLRPDDLPPRARGRLRVCPHCGHHMRLPGAQRRLELLFDDGKYQRIELPKSEPTR